MCLEYRFQTGRLSSFSNLPPIARQHLSPSSALFCDLGSVTKFKFHVRTPERPVPGSHRVAESSLSSIYCVFPPRSHSQITSVSFGSCRFWPSLAATNRQRPSSMIRLTHWGNLTENSQEEPQDDSPIDVHSIVPRRGVTKAFVKLRLRLHSLRLVQSNIVLRSQILHRFRRQATPHLQPDAREIHATLETLRRYCLI
jgi:hypothetical protein